MPTGQETMTSRERLLAALNHEQPDRVPIDLGGNQTGIHKLAYQALSSTWASRTNVTIMDAVQQLARPCEAVLERFHVDTRYIAAGAAAGLQGRDRHRQRDGRIWHDLTDEFGVTWSMPDDQPLYMDITHHPLADATIDDIRDYPFPQGRRSRPLRRAARAGPADPPRNALRRGQRHLRRGLRNLLVHARAGTLVHGHARAAGVLRGPARPDAEVLAGLVRRVPGRGGRRGRRDHDRRRPGRPDGPLFQPDVLPPRRQAAAEAAGAVHPVADARPRSGITPAARARRTSPTCWTTASTSSTRCRSAPPAWTRPS